MATISSTMALNDAMSPALRSMAAAVGSLTAAFQDMQRVLGVAMDTREINQATDALEQTERQQDEVNQSLREGSNAAGDLWGKIKGFIAAYAGWELVKQTGAWVDEMTNIQARLAQVNIGGQGVSVSMAQIYANAQDAHASLQGMADIVARFGNNAKDAFSSNDELLTFSNQLYKMFSIAGTDQNGAAAAMLQLSQGLGAGVLRGEELNSVFEQAPIIIQTIAKHLGVPVGQIRQLASEGKLTADVVKNALLGAADETNKKFAEMPLTFGAMWTMAKNTFQQNIMGLQKVISGIFNSGQFQQMMNDLTEAVSTFAVMAIPVVKGVAAAVGFMHRNWSLIAPVIFTVIGAITAYKVAVLAMAAAEAISKAVKVAMVIASYAKAAATGVEVSATTAATAAQWGLNTALYACPITWIVLGLIALIGIIYLVVATINKMTGSTISATGIITGALSTAWAFIYNGFWGLMAGIFDAIEGIVQPVMNIIQWLYNAFTGGFDSIGKACLNLLGNTISAALGVVKPILRIWDWVTGMNAAGAVEAAQRAAEDWGKNEKGKSQTVFKAGWMNDYIREKMPERKEYGAAWESGYSAGESFAADPMGAIKGALGLAEDPAIQQLLDGQKQGNALAAQTAENTAPKEDESFKYIRDLMAGRAIDRLAGTDIRIQMNNNNNVNSGMDLDKMVDALARKLTGAMDSAAEGVHY